jgi:hypothetical protein
MGSTYSINGGRRGIQVGYWWMHIIKIDFREI